MMRAIILVAGRGSRLTKNLSIQPKTFLKIGKKTILQKLIDNFQLNGVKEIALVTGYKAYKFNSLKIKKFHNKKWNKTNMVFSLKQANNWLSKYPCIVSYGDIFYEKKIIKKLKDSKKNISICYDKNWKKLWEKRFKNPLDDAETFKISNKNIIKEIGKKTKDINDIQGQYMGLMKFRPKGWRTFKLCLKKDFLNRYKNLYLTDVFQKLIEKNYLLYGIKYLGKWAEVDSRKDYLIMKKIFK